MFSTAVCAFFTMLVLYLINNSVRSAALGELEIISNEDQRECEGIKTSKKRGTNPSIATWPKNSDGFVRMPYTIHSTLSTEGKLGLEQGILMYNRYTCVLLEPKLDTDNDYVDFQDDGTGCWSYLGRTGGKQALNLQQNGCVSTLGTPLHEIAHALGVHHEQSRPDRDQYVTIYLDNVITGSNGEDYTGNFEKEDGIDSLGTPYDYLSIMHYGSTAFAKDGTNTILKNDGTTVVSIQRNGFSEIDVEQINLLYECNGVKNAANEVTSCYYTGDRGFSYRGTSNSGTVGSTVHTCDNWATNVNVEEFYLNGLTENYCRNVNVMLYDKPMCFVTLNNIVYYLECDVEVCPETTTTTTTTITTTQKASGCVSDCLSDDSITFIRYSFHLLFATQFIMMILLQF